MKAEALEKGKRYVHCVELAAGGWQRTYGEFVGKKPGGEYEFKAEGDEYHEAGSSFFLFGLDCVEPVPRRIWP